MPITLTIADDEDGTGATATVAGAAAADSTVVYYFQYSGNGSHSWTAGPTITGNDSAAVTLSTMGTYWFHGIVTIDATGDDEVTNMTYLAVTNGTDPTFKRILDGVQSRIRAIGLSGITSGNVVVLKLPWDRQPLGRSLPYVIVSPVRETFTGNDKLATNVHDRIGYGVLVVIAQSSDQDLESEETVLDWRHRIFKAFRNHSSLSGVVEILSIDVQPGDPFIPSAFKENIDASALVLRAYTRETRGI